RGGVVVKVRVRLFAALREIAGSEEVELEVPDGTTAEGVWESLVAGHPKLAPYTGVVQVAINQDFADRRTELQPEDELAFLPPLSGG
ncbi:MAG: molybdopterin converting factor subunit 1, partial [Acidobacteriota bacterium]